MKIAGGLAIVLALVGGIVLGWRWKPSPAPVPPALQHDTVWMSAKQLTAAAPTARPGLAARITHHKVPPDLIAIGQPERDVPPDSAAVTRSDSAPASESAKPDQSQNSAGNQEPPTLPYLRGKYGSGRLELWVGRSDGSILYQRHAVHVPFDFVADSGQLTAHEERAWLRLLKGAGRCVGAAAIGGAAGALVVGKDRPGGAIVGAAAGCGGSLVF